MTLPAGLRFTKDHEWAKIEENVATIGITEFAVEQLGDITLVELPEVGDDVEEGETIGTIESVKAVSDLFCPLTGKIAAINEELDDAPESVNDSPYEKGWMLKIEFSDQGEVDKLLDVAGYQAHLDSDAD
jgi:glycine cleavage system H protein